MDILLSIYSGNFGTTNLWSVVYVFGKTKVEKCIFLHYLDFHVLIISLIPFDRSLVKVLSAVGVIKVDFGHYELALMMTKSHIVHVAQVW